MAESAQLPCYDFADYLALEQWSDIKHEYVDGVIIAMTGASKTHDIIVNNLQNLLGNYLQGTPCRASDSDLKLRITALNRTFYPDLMVVCSDPKVGSPYYGTDAKLIIEVLSESTEDYDRTVKAQAYKSLPSLQEYCLVAQDKACIECLRRVNGQWWDTFSYNNNDQIKLLGGGLTLSMTDVYERLPFIEL